MIELLHHQEIDKTQWEACLQKAETPLVYAHAWYLDAVCGNTWQALVEQQNGEYISIFPVPVKKQLGQKIVYQPLFSQQLGLFCTAEIQHRSVEEYLALLPTFFAQVQYQLPLPKTELNLGENWNFRQRPNYELSLQAPYQIIQQGYATNLKRNLKKAYSENLSATADSSFETLLHLFKETKGKELSDLKDRHYKILARLYEYAKKAGVGQLWQVMEQQEVLCVAFLLFEGYRITYLFGASSERGRQVNAMAFLMDQLIRQEAGSGRTLDFEGSEVPGVAKFYANFGAQPVPYLSLSFHNQSLARQWTRNAFISLAKRLR